MITQSYLVAPEEGIDTDCLTDDSVCEIDCDLFPVNSSAPRFSGYKRVGYIIIILHLLSITNLVVLKICRRHL